MFSEIIYFLTFSVFVAACCPSNPYDECGQEICLGGFPLSAEEVDILYKIPSHEDSVCEQTPGQICDQNCVKTILRHKPVTQITFVPTECRPIETYQTRPILQQVLQDSNQASCSRSSNQLPRYSCEIQTTSNCQTFPSLSKVAEYTSKNMADSDNQNVQKNKLKSCIVSNDCKCVKTILRHKPVTRISIVPTEHRYVETFSKPVIRQVQWKYNQQTVPKVRLVHGSVSTQNLLSGLSQFVENIAQLNLTQKYCENTAESSLLSSFNPFDSQQENCEQGFVNLSQLPTCN